MENAKNDKPKSKKKKADEQKALDVKYAAALKDNEKLKITITRLQEELKKGKAQADEDQSTIERLEKETTSLGKDVLRAAALAHEQARNVNFLNQIKKNLQKEIDNLTIESNKHMQAINSLRRERDKSKAQSLKQVQIIEDIRSEMELKQSAINDFREKLAESELLVQNQKNLYETLTDEYKHLTNLLLRTTNESTEKRQEIKMANYEISQLKEDIKTKERELIRTKWALTKSEKENEHLEKVEMKKLKDQLEITKKKMVPLKIEISNLDRIIKNYEKENKKLNLVNNQLLNEVDIFGTHLASKQDRVTHLDERERLLRDFHNKREAEYDQRVEDIRLLKLEVSKLRHEKYLLIRNTKNTADYRQENLHLQREIMETRLRSRALESELQNPINPHYSKIIENVDPETYTSMQKMKILMKQAVFESKKSLQTQTKLRAEEKRNKNLEEVLSRQPGPEVAERLQKTQKALKSRDTQIKCLIADVEVHKTMALEAKYHLETANEELKNIKEKYYKLKLIHDKTKINNEGPSNNSTLPLIDERNATPFSEGQLSDEENPQN